MLPDISIAELTSMGWLFIIEKITGLYIKNYRKYEIFQSNNMYISKFNSFCTFKINFQCFLRKIFVKLVNFDWQLAKKA